MFLKRHGVAYTEHEYDYVEHGGTEVSSRELGVAVFFITGRPENLREATERNLRAQGYEWEQVVLTPQGGHFDHASDFKAPARRRITERGYTILLSMGDQQSDLDGGYAEKTFKLPNPVYLLP